MKKKSKHKRTPSLTAWVAFSVTMLILYTIANEVIVCLTGYTNDTLTTCFFGVFGGEILTCAVIKIFKLKREGE